MSEKSVEDFLDSFATKNGGILSFRDFSEIALFAPGCGYYTRQRGRVGFGSETDFYTASSVGEIFGRLVTAAAKTLLGKGTNPKEFSFIEIGAEPSCDNLASAREIFADARVFRLGEKIEIPEKAVVFANELFDAQPFHRLVFMDGRWRESGVSRDENGCWREKVLPRVSSERLQSFIDENLPKEIDEGWRIDISLDAEDLMQKILVGTSWSGAFIFSDYGKTLNDCLESFPEGTARAYFRHTISNDLLSNPGEQDLTCHVFWDRLTRVAKSCEFSNVKTLRQEAFFMTYSLEEIEKIVVRTTKGRSAEGVRNQSKLMELIHPSKMGHAFQVLSGTRGI